MYIKKAMVSILDGQDLAMHLSLLAFAAMAVPPTWTFPGDEQAAKGMAGKCWIRSNNFNTMGHRD